jgi:hypothetical protein
MVQKHKELVEEINVLKQELNLLIQEKKQAFLDADQLESYRSN